MVALPVDGPADRSVLPHLLCCHLPAPPFSCLLPLPRLCRMANRLRSVLPEEERAVLEATLGTLAPLFDLRTPHPADAAPEGQTEVGPELAAGHAVIEELAAAGCERADALAQAAADSAAQLVVAGVPSSEQQPGAAGGSGEGAPQAANAAAAASQQQRQQQPGGAGEAAAAPAPAALKALHALHADGVRSVAELCSLCLERLLALGRSLSSHYRYGRPANDGERWGTVAWTAPLGVSALPCCIATCLAQPTSQHPAGIAWPPAAEAAGLALRGQALRMLEELQAMAAAFGASLAEAGSHLDAAAGSKAYSAAAKPLAHGLQEDSEAAATRVQDASRALLQVCWLKSVPREVLEELL